MGLLRPEPGVLAPPHQSYRTLLLQPSGLIYADTQRIGRWHGDGARSKANFTDLTGKLWFAKFPSKGDRYDVGGWEFLVHEMAPDAGF